MEKELPKTYNPKTVDSKWYEFWDRHGFFTADPTSDKPRYSLVLPPPNVTGILHMGHALGTTLQDILVRWKRMQGFEVLWVPGTDHAGIATQTVVEKQLIQTENKRRADFSREEFLQRVWEWKEKSEKRIITQLKKLGASCDWTRQRFTMDEKSNKAVRTQFSKLYKEGLIYRGNYLVNWDPVTKTALADDEVEYEERSTFLWHFKYPYKDGSGFVKIATTRPETMLGDTAIAVSPKDPRYRDVIGKSVLLPLMEREIPVIADPHVDPEFGTGMVKITPAHDPNDYEMGIAHNLPMINIMTPDGKINENGGAFTGLSMQEARQKIVEKMKELGLLEQIEPHVHRVGISYRSKAVIEPYISKQWFIKMDGFAKKLSDAVKLDKTKIIPKNFESTYFHWIDNLRDWCISRQLWWGHRIPIWYNKTDPDKTLCQEGELPPKEVQEDPNSWVQEEDVLDTWFSSALWPFSTLGWPEKTEELNAFYPLSVMITGHDILFFWVARMLLMGEYTFNKLPFPETFLTGVIFGKTYWRQDPKKGVLYVSDEERLAYDMGQPLPRDVTSKWEKMSKSKGNVIDPLEIIEQYGTDAMRMALCSSATQAREIDLDRRRFEDFKNFANKIWNGARFTFLNLDQESSPLTAKEFSEGLDREALRLEDRWILSLLNHTIGDVNGSLAAYAFDQAATRAYDFFWKEFCSYYLEMSKPYLFGKFGTPIEQKNKQKLLVIILCLSMRLIHPIAPFISEELFQRLKNRLKGVALNEKSDPYTKECIQALSKEACIVAPYPTVIDAKAIDPEIERAFAVIERVVYTIRNIRGEMQIPPHMPTDIHLIGSPHDSDFTSLIHNEGIIHSLVRTDTIYPHEREEPTHIGFASTSMVGQIKVIVPLPGNLIQQEKERLIKEQKRLSSTLDKIQNQLSNTQFLEKAPKELIDKQRQQMEQTRHELEAIALKLRD